MQLLPLLAWLRGWHLFSPLWYLDGFYWARNSARYDKFRLTCIEDSLSAKSHRPSPTLHRATLAWGSFFEASEAALQSLKPTAHWEQPPANLHATTQALGTNPCYSDTRQFFACWIEGAFRGYLHLEAKALGAQRNVAMWLVETSGTPLLNIHQRINGLRPLFFSNVWKVYVES
jgi:hypothetical protein